MLGALGELADGAGPLGVDRVTPPLTPTLVGARRAARRDVVGLVDDEDVEREAVSLGPLRREGVSQQALGPLAGQPGHGDDDPREQRERVGVQAVGSAHVAHRLGVDDREVETELLGHLVLPLQAESGRADDDDRAGPVAQQQLLDDQAGLDGLAEADVVGEQQVGARASSEPARSGSSW